MSIKGTRCQMNLSLFYSETMNFGAYMCMHVVWHARYINAFMHLTGTTIPDEFNLMSFRDHEFASTYVYACSATHQMNKRLRTSLWDTKTDLSSDYDR